MLKDGDQIVIDQDGMVTISVNCFTNLFCFAGDYIDTNVVEDVIYSLVTSNMNNILTSLPSFEEIRSAVFSLNKNSAPRPDSFEGIFFHTY